MKNIQAQTGGIIIRDPIFRNSFPGFNTGILGFKRSTVMDHVLNDWSEL